VAASHTEVGISSSSLSRHGPPGRRCACPQQPGGFPDQFAPVISAFHSAAFGTS